jgi:hypothetical protein
MKNDITPNESTKSNNQDKRIFDRRLKVNVDGIANMCDKFTLENGYYVNENETVIIQSTNETGKFFRKVSVPS